MKDKVKILVVEDEMIIAAKIAMHLEKMGFEVSAIVARGEEAVGHCIESKPDLMLLDINLKGSMNGIETAKTILEKVEIPIIYLTANDDQMTFELAKETHPYAFLTKPYKKVDLQRAIDLVVNRISNKTINTPDIKDPSSYILNDRIFIRHKDSMVKLFLSDILYIEAERSYCSIVSLQGKHTLSMPLKKLEDKLSLKSFFRIHRSYIINLELMDEVGENHVVMGQKVIPIGKSFKGSFFQRIQLI